MNNLEYEDNRIIKKAVNRLNKLNDERYTYMLADVLMHRMYEEGVAPTPVEGDDLFIYEDGKGRLWFPLFTDEDEFEKGITSPTYERVEIKRILKEGLDNPDVRGVIINPFGESRKLLKSTLEMTFLVYKKEYNIEE